jgi:hypothetical protein
MMTLLFFFFFVLCFPEDYLAQILTLIFLHHKQFVKLQMSREDNVFMAKLAEQAERYPGERM